MKLHISILALAGVSETIRRGLAVTASFLGLLLAAVLLGCSGQGGAVSEASETSSATPAADAEKGADSEPAAEVDERVPVETVRLATGEIEAVLRFSTNLEAESEVQVFSQAARLVTRLLVEEGDTVRKGQLLLRLQDDEQRSALARVESQLGKARREYERQQRLYSRELISEQAINDATYEVEQLELAVEDARRGLGYTEVTASISGTITGRHVNRGDHITINQHLFDMVDFDSIVARVYVPEKELYRLRKGQVARLYPGTGERQEGGSGAAPGSPSSVVEARAGRVLRIAPIVDPRSGTVKVTIAIPRHQGLVPGMYVEVELVTEVHEQALLIPKRAVIYDSNQAFLYRLDDELRAERLRIEPLLEDRDFLEPRADSALAVGDEIVVAGQAGLKSGVLVRRAGLSGAETSDAETSDDEISDVEPFGVGDSGDSVAGGDAG